MTGIICAIRGGPDSQPTIERAISLAQDVGQPLYFLYIVNFDFLLSHSESSRFSTLQEELTQMGEFILLTAQEKAQVHGVNSEAVIRQGEVGDEIVSLADELNADYIVLGTPVGDEERNVFLMDRLEEFSARLEQESGAKVILTQTNS
jgi:nucleotide-binding universal stress UspA family protein